MKSFTDYIQESVIDLPRNSLDPNVFLFEDGVQPILNPAIKRQIIQDIHEIEGVARIKDFYMVGSILTKTYNSDSDIDITLEMDETDVDDITEINMLTIIKRLNGRLAVSTTHPINYYFELTSEPIDYRFDAIYDVINERWRKEPKHFHINIEDYVKKFQSTVSTLDLTTAELRRDIIDIEELSKFSKGEIGNIKEIMQSKLYEISQKVEELIDKKKFIKKSRVEAFSKPWTPEEIHKFKSKSRLPENVIYKLLQKYYYWDFIQKLEQILGDKENLSIKDVKEIKKAEKDFYSESYAENLNSKDVAIFGIAEEDGHVNIESGNVHDKHSDFNMISRYGVPFRYIPKTKTIYWWTKPTTAMIESSTLKLESYGFKVTNGNEIITTDKSYNITHGFHESFESFANHPASLLSEKIKTLKMPRVDWRDAKKRKQYAKSHGQLNARGMDRKNLRQIPEYRRNVTTGKSAGNVASAKRIIDMAKKAPSGVWRLTPMQVKWVANEYHHIPPNDKKSVKHLGNTGIMVWKKGDKYLLVKQHKSVMH